MFPKYFEKIPFYTHFRDSIYSHYVNAVKHHYPQKYADILFQQVFGYNIDWKHPRDLNEWINYLAFKTDTSAWTRLADKYRVRDYIKEKGLANILVPLLAKYDTPNEIDLNALPNKFVLKCNNGNGDVIIVRDKTKIYPNQIKEKLSHSLQSKFGLDTAEPHYLKIKPCIIAEELLPSTGISVVDYKVWCFNGKPFCIFTVSNRNFKTHTADYNLFTLEWDNLSQIYLAEPFKNGLHIDKPPHLTEMLHDAQILSEGFPQIRVDFYEVNNRIYFGEMTFTSQCGRMDYFTPEFLKIMGQKVNLQSA